jgi:hypothetical protein
MQLNPYRSPETVNDDRPPGTRFRFRVIPTTFSVLWTIGTSLSAAMSAVWYVLAKLHLESEFTVFPIGRFSGLTSISAVLWALAALSWWRGRWWPAISYTLVAMVLCYITVEYFPPVAER